ncbi:Uncharacterised protein [Mycobacteroides abscessus subsp. abscessus]|nr:Uncharacterised protein [Mycobacteroides abscessus subsp. abscessus]
MVRVALHQLMVINTPPTASRDQMGASRVIWSPGNWACKCSSVTWAMRSKTP